MNYMILYHIRSEPGQLLLHDAQRLDRGQGSLAPHVCRSTSLHTVSALIQMTRSVFKSSCFFKTSSRLWGFEFLHAYIS